VKRHFAVLGLQWQIVWTLLRRTLLVACRTRLFFREVRRMLFGQLGVDRPSHHLPGLMTELFDFGERRFPRRPVVAEPLLCQQCHQLIELSLFFERQIEVLISSVLDFERPCS